MKTSKKAVIFVIIYAIAITMIYFFMQEAADFEKIANNLTYLHPIIPAVFGFFAFRYFGIKTLSGKSLLFLLIGVMSWVLGDILWWMLGADGSVTFADFVYLIGYLSISTGIVFGVKTIDSNFFSNKKRLLMICMIAVIAVVIYFKVFPLAWNPESTPLENMVASGYVLGDFIILISTVAIILTALGGSFSRPWIVIGIGVLSIWIADIYYFLNLDTYKGGNLIDLGWIYGYLLFALGFIFMKETAEKAIESDIAEKPVLKNKK